MAKQLTKLRSAIQRGIAEAYSGRDELRVKIEELKKRREDLDRVPLPLAEAEANLDQHIARLRASCGFNATSYVFGTQPDPLFGALPSGASDRHLSMLVAAFCPEGFRKYQLEGIRKAYSNLPPPLSAAERLQAAAALDREIFDAEVSEEAVICDLEELTGAPLPRRYDADPRAVLGLPYRPGAIASATIEDRPGEGEGDDAPRLALDPEDED